MDKNIANANSLNTNSYVCEPVFSKCNMRVSLCVVLCVYSAVCCRSSRVQPPILRLGNRNSLESFVDYFENSIESSGSSTLESGTVHHIVSIRKQQGVGVASLAWSTRSTFRVVHEVLRLLEGTSTVSEELSSRDPLSNDVFLSSSEITAFGQSIDPSGSASANAEGARVLWLVPLVGTVGSMPGGGRVTKSNVSGITLVKAILTDQIPSRGVASAPAVTVESAEDEFQFLEYNGWESRTYIVSATADGIRSAVDSQSRNDPLSLIDQNMMRMPLGEVESLRGILGELDNLAAVRVQSMIHPLARGVASVVRSSSQQPSLYDSVNQRIFQVSRGMTSMNVFATGLAMSHGANLLDAAASEFSQAATIEALDDGGSLGGGIERSAAGHTGKTDGLYYTSEIVRSHLRDTLALRSASDDFDESTLVYLINIKQLIDILRLEARDGVALKAGLTVLVMDTQGVDVPEHGLFSVDQTRFESFELADI